MPYLPVDIFVLNKSGGNAPIEGVLVRLLDWKGRLIRTQGATNSMGMVSFLLPTELSPYQARCYKSGVAFDAPFSIELSETEANLFNLYGDAIIPPVSKDARVCVAYGYFKDGTNSPFAGCTIHFMPRFEPLIIDGSAVLKERTLSRTDEEGYLEIGLIRCAKYDVMIEGMEDVTRTINVPDTVNVNLPDLLFPVVDRIDLAAPIALTVGQELDLYPTVWTSSGLQLEGPARLDIRWSSSDPTIVACTPMQDRLILRGMAVGTAQLQGVRYDNSVVRIPNTPIGGLPIYVTVT